MCILQLCAFINSSNLLALLTNYLGHSSQMVIEKSLVCSNIAEIYQLLDIFLWAVSQARSVVPHSERPCLSAATPVPFKTHTYTHTLYIYILIFPLFLSSSFSFSLSSFFSPSSNPPQTFSETSGRQHHQAVRTI